VLGDLSGADTDLVLAGVNKGSCTGGGLTGGGDLDGDDIPDVVIGAPFDNEGGEYAGKVYVVPGGDLEF
jgi:hypothetical protein